MQILRTEISSRFETGASYFHKVSFFGEGGQSITVEYASESLLTDEAEAEEHALRAMAETAGLMQINSVVEDFPTDASIMAAPGEAEDDDDNPYQESDDALPSDDEENAISRSPTRESSRFDEI